jgi:protein-tyrosine phosphatase
LNPVRTHAEGILKEELGITHVLSTNRMSPQVLEPLQQELQRLGIQHLYVPGDNTMDCDMIGRHWKECHEFLQHALVLQKEETVKIVIHCSAGVNRSGLMVAAAMLAFGEQTLLPVVQHLKNQRGIVLTNASFQRQLCLLAARLGRLGDQPEGYSNDAPAVDHHHAVVPPRRTAASPEWWDDYFEEEE